MLVILDRDGVINFDSDQYIKCPGEWLAIPGSLEAITRLNQAGHQVVIATNQSGVGRDKYTLEVMHAIHHKMQTELTLLGGHIDKIYYCPHHPAEDCACRKPKPGMLLDICRDYPQQFQSAVFVGDSRRDLQAGEAAGCRVVLVKTGNGLATIKNFSPEVPIYADLAAYVDELLAE